MGIEVIGGSGGGAKSKRIDRFTSTSSWTAPADVTYVIARIVSGGGGGGGKGENDGNTGSSSGFDAHSFSGGRGGMGVDHTNNSGSQSGQPNTGQGGSGMGSSFEDFVGGSDGVQSEPVYFGQAVIPETAYTVTIGAGGSGGGGGASGGSGFVELEYYVED